MTYLVLIASPLGDQLVRRHVCDIRDTRHERPLELHLEKLFLGLVPGLQDGFELFALSVVAIRRRRQSVLRRVRLRSGCGRRRGIQGQDVVVGW